LQIHGVRSLLAKNYTSLALFYINNLSKRDFIVPAP